jgi:hypothetical protein
MTTKNSEGIKDARMVGMMIQKRKGRESRSSNDVMRNGFPNSSVQQRKQEGVEDALVE